MKTWAVPAQVFLFVVMLYSCKGAGEELIWQQEFDGPELDETQWGYQLGDGCPDLCGWGNNEPQIYTSKNHRIEQGKLYIQARQEDSAYTSSRLTTRGKFDFTYGRMEVRAKFPRGKGLWPAIWLLGSQIDQGVPWPDCGEISFIEYLGKQPGQMFSMLHTAGAYGIDTPNKEYWRQEGLEDGFHLYEMKWTADYLRFSVDGVPFYTYAPAVKTPENWPFDYPFFITVNMAVGGNLGGPDVDDGAFPQELVVDYIRVYKD